MQLQLGCLGSRCHGDVWGEQNDTEASQVQTTGATEERDWMMPAGSVGVSSNGRDRPVCFLNTTP